MPIVLLYEAIKAKYTSGKKILFILLVLAIFLPLWVIDYGTLYNLARISLYNMGIIDQLTEVQVSGESMLPTIQSGETVSLHNPYKYGIARGDLISFRNIETGGVSYIKRAIAFEGENISIQNGSITIDNKVLNEDYVYNLDATYGNTFLVECGVYEVPKDHVAVFGDNRTGSTDSRVIGFVQKDDIVGVIKKEVDYSRIASNKKNTDLKALDINEFVNLINKKREQTESAPLIVNPLLTDSAAKRADDISSDVAHWKDSGTSLTNYVESSGYDYVTVQEIVTMGNYNESELTKHVLELYPYGLDIVSPNYYEIGVARTQGKHNSCTVPVTVIAIGWPTTPNWAQDVYTDWQKDIDAMTTAITSLKTLIGNPNVPVSETQELIDDLTELISEAGRVQGFFGENRWPSDSEISVLDDYVQKSDDTQLKLADYVRKYLQYIDDPALAGDLDGFKWGNPEFNSEADKARSAFSEGDYQAQLESGNKLIEIASNDEEKAIGHYWVGLAYHNLNDMTKAKVNLLKAVELDSTYAGPYVTLASVSYSEGNYQEGLNHALKCAQLDPNYGWCFNNIGLGYAYLGNTNLAVQNLEKAVALDPESYVFNDNLKRVKEGL